ncbi:hypothetical protein [Methylobacterium sp. SD21]|uniref:hypothetical protein n=1 Tax=Methylobacterium litchii TaxID=3138810 RepID=UPI00313C29F1
MDAATKALLDAARNRVRNECTYAQRRAERSGEAFSITGREWMRIWRASPHALEPGHMVRPYPDEPWSPTNCEYVQGTADGRHRRKAERLDRIAQQ